MTAKEIATWLSELNQAEVFARQLQLKGVVSSLNIASGFSKLELSSSANEYDVDAFGNSLSPSDETIEDFEPHQPNNSNEPNNSSYSTTRDETKEPPEVESAVVQDGDLTDRWPRKRPFGQAFVQEQLLVFTCAFEWCPHSDWRTAFTSKEQRDVHLANCPFRTHSVGHSHSPQSLHTPTVDGMAVLPSAGGPGVQQPMDSDLLGLSEPAVYIPDPFPAQDMRPQQPQQQQQQAASLNSCRDGLRFCSNFPIFLQDQRQQQQGIISRRDLRVPLHGAHGTERSDAVPGKDLSSGGGALVEGHKGSGELEHSFAPERTTDFGLGLAHFPEDLDFGMTLAPLVEIEPDYWYFGA